MTNDRILGGAALALAAIMIAFGYGLDAPFSYEPVGPKAFPLLTAGIIAACGMALLIGRGGAVDTAAGPGTNRALLLLSAALLVYALLFEPLGFLLATALLMTPVAMVFGAKWWQGLVTGIGLAASFYVIFDRGLQVVLPAGLLRGVV